MEHTLVCVCMRVVWEKESAKLYNENVEWVTRFCFPNKSHTSVHVHLRASFVRKKIPLYFHKTQFRVKKKLYISVIMIEMIWLWIVDNWYRPRQSCVRTIISVALFFFQDILQFSYFLIACILFGSNESEKNAWLSSIKFSHALLNCGTLFKHSLSCDNKFNKYAVKL